MINDPETMVKIQNWRSKVLNNTITLEEMKEAIVYLRGSRKASFAASPSKPPKSKTPTRSSDDLLKELEGL